jgi:hypothetical protein
MLAFSLSEWRIRQYHPYSRQYHYAFPFTYPAMHVLCGGVGGRMGRTVGGPAFLTATWHCVWSFAKEGALPAKKGRINRYLDVPVNAILLVAFMISGMSFI